MFQYNLRIHVQRSENVCWNKDLDYEIFLRLVLMIPAFKLEFLHRYRCIRRSLFLYRGVGLGNALASFSRELRYPRLFRFSSQGKSVIILVRFDF